VQEEMSQKKPRNYASPDVAMDVEVDVVDITDRKIDADNHAGKLVCYFKRYCFWILVLDSRHQNDFPLSSSKRLMKCLYASCLL